MNIENAKTVALPDLLSKLGIEPKKRTETEAWYLSPFREEKEASFKVNLKKNIWYDFGEGHGGDIIRFACTYLENNNESNTVSDALRFIQNMAGDTPRITPVETDDGMDESPKLSVMKVNDIAHPALLHYLEKRGISPVLAAHHLKEVRVKNKDSGKSMFALGLKNEDDGYELRNPFFKGTVGHKNISFIRGTKPKPPGLHIFEGFMDYLSIIMDCDRPCLEDDTIILNSLSCLSKATPYIKSYGYKTAWTYMDNDDQGKKALQSLNEFFQTEEGLEHRPMNASYEGCKDVNDWHMRKLGLTL